MSRSLPRRLALGLSACSVAALLALVVLEGLLRWQSRGADRFYVWPPGLELTFQPDPTRMPGVSGPSLFRASSLGLRGDELGSTASPRVIAIGGSTTECLYLDQAEAWPALVQAELGANAWVGNAGVSGRLTRDHVVQIEHLLPVLPSLDRVVLLVGVNDLMLFLGQGEGYDPRGLDAPGERDRALRRSFEVVPRRFDPARFPRSTELWRRVVNPLRESLGTARSQDVAGSIYDVWREHRASSATRLDELPDLAAPLAEFRRNVELLVEACRAAGTRPLFLTQPCLWSASPAPEIEALFWMGGVGDYQKAPGAPYYTSRALAEGMERYNRALVEACAELGVDCLDLAAAVPPDPAYFYDDVHFTEEGARRVAAEVAGGLR